MAFVVGALFTVISVPLIAKLDIKVKKNDKSIVATVKCIMGMLDFNIFILVELIIGMCHGFHPIYRPVFAKELNASKTLIGFSKSNRFSSFNFQLHLFFSSNRFTSNCQRRRNDDSSKFRESNHR